MSSLCPICKEAGICHISGAADQYRQLTNPRTPPEKLFGLVRFFLEAQRDYVGPGCQNQAIIKVVACGIVYIDRHGLRRYYTDEYSLET